MCRRITVQEMQVGMNRNLTEQTWVRSFQSLQAVERFVHFPGELVDKLNIVFQHAHMYSLLSYSNFQGHVGHYDPCDLKNKYKTSFFYKFPYSSMAVLLAYLLFSSGQSEEV
ncbi:hypothetical protein ACIQXV_15340 [Neobacillus sp. NPDC097160]|uniref:hypothetical protein n=1 Tax=Neobacillus sp. NPDC097160 TaxID=3364298 RepID=UPI003807EE0D